MNIQKIKINNVSHTQPIKVNNAQSIVFNMKTQEKVVIPTKETQHINPDIGYNALSKVIVEPIPVNYIQPTETKKISSNGIHNIKEYANVEVDVQPSLQDKTVIVKPSDNIYIMPDEDYYGLAVVNVVGAVDTENVEITPTKEVQTITRSEYKYIENVKVNAIPDEYIIPSGELEITENGNYDVTDKASVKVETSGVDINNYFDTYYDETTTSYWVRDSFVLKLPDVVVDDSVTSLAYICGDTWISPKIICNDNVKSMAHMYESCKAKVIDLSGLNTTNVTNMDSMLSSCSNIINIDVSNFDTSKVTNMERVFSSCRSLTSLDLSNFKTNKVTTMREMFYYCDKLKELDLSNFNTENVTTMYCMFQSCYALTSLDLSNFDTSNVTSMYSMFGYSENFETIDISSFTSEKLTNNSYMFVNCKKLTKLIINNPNLFKLTNVNAFNNTPIKDGTGFVYVPDDMVETYKTATNWSTYATQIKGMSELDV